MAFCHKLHFLNHTVTATNYRHAFQYPKVYYNIQSIGEGDPEARYSIPSFLVISDSFNSIEVCFLKTLGIFKIFIHMID